MHRISLWSGIRRCCICGAPLPIGSLFATGVFLSYLMIDENYRQALGAKKVIDPSPVPQCLATVLRCLMSRGYEVCASASGADFMGVRGGALAGLSENILCCGFCPCPLSPEGGGRRGGVQRALRGR